MRGIVAPSLLSADFANLREELASIEKTHATWIHLDVMDGHFVPNITFGPPLIKSIRANTTLFLDTHLMISDPAKYVQTFADAGSDLITFHAEACKNPEEIVKIIDNIKKLNKKAGLSIKPKTSVASISNFLDLLDLVLVMTVEPGFGGQKFMHDAADKIRQIREIAPKIDIQVDGGIDAETGKISAELGANVLVAGSYVFGNENCEAAVYALSNALDKSGFPVN
ncbi:MAG: ribulose-phosphate 3-epimerase [Planctomycetes bacterium]|nr:ribulose-phosphate 3-epimerase [Planctomycetota bacterium]